ncbi:hypothetical protein PM082_015488 [Marasmius tenuissimus]|nr:hypothetical protein PM082_015488 [Marasmius tenuissimus]
MIHLSLAIGEVRIRVPVILVNAHVKPPLLISCRTGVEIGRKHGIFEESECLAINIFNHRLWPSILSEPTLNSVGALGEGKTDLERRQEAQEKWGQTKKSRTAAAINEREKRRRLPVTDARPPDTIRALLAQSGRKRKRQSSEKPSIAQKKPLATLQPASPKPPSSHRSTTTTVTPRCKDRRRSSLNLVSSPIRPLKSPLVKRI